LLLRSLHSYRYETYVSTLGQFPGTMFGRMFDPKNRALLRKDHKGEYLIDRNGRVFEGILGV
jgi:BTB/POZ domain